MGKVEHTARQTSQPWPDGTVGQPTRSLIKFVEHRVADPRILRLIQEWLKAGEPGQHPQKKQSLLRARTLHLSSRKQQLSLPAGQQFKSLRPLIAYYLGESIYTSNWPPGRM